MATKGCVITTTGYTLTINGSLHAGPYPIFTGTGTVSLKEAYPEWFDASGGTDYAPAFAAIASNSIPKTILQAGKNYPISPVLGATWYYNGVDNIVIEGNFATLTVASGTGLSYGVGIYAKDADGLSIRNLTIDGNRETMAFDVDGASHGVMLQYVRNAVLDNLIIKDMATDGVYIGPDPDTQTLRSDNIEVRNCKIYRSRRNNISLTGATNVRIYGGTNKSAGEDSGTSTGTAPKAGIDLEPNTSGATYANQNVIVQGMEFDDNVTYDMIIQKYATDIHIKNNPFTITGTGVHCANSATITRLTVADNFFTGGAYGFVASLTTGNLSYLTLNNNKFYNQTTADFYLEGDTHLEHKIVNNTFEGAFYLMYFSPTTGPTTNKHVIMGNTHISTGDELAGDSDVVLYNNCHFSNEQVFRSGAANSYRARFNSLLSTGNTLITVGALIYPYDANAGYPFAAGQDIDEVWGTRLVRWKAAAAPVAGTWVVGAEVINNAPAAGGAGIVKWLCTTGGTPGTWTSLTLN
jgi:hypothetical protein